MKVYDHLSKVDLPSIAITIGNFDGVHSGHQDIIKKIMEECEKSSRELVVITFLPHPIHILSPRSNFLLNSYEERRELLKNIGLKHLVEIEFTRDLSTYSPEKFMQEYILENSKVETFYIGHDFAFGADKKGDHDFVKSFCKDKGVEVKTLNQHFESGNEVSSSVVRNLLDNGEVAKANAILGRQFFLEGRVIKGEGRGKKIGIPTANITLSPERKIPKRGVYITETIVAGQTWQSVTNIGFNPTFNDEEKTFIETHILDFDNDIYGDSIRVSFIKKIRDEQKFSSVNELIEQIKKDIEVSRGHFKHD